MTISQLGLGSPMVLHDQETRGLAESIRSLQVVADPDIELREGGGRFFFACPAGLSSFCDFFFTQNKGGPGRYKDTFLHNLNFNIAYVRVQRKF